ncbi:MAG: hypothetical protein M3547_00335 [Acidobacteriota bacterium]|nr:hypothetical protein [Acidobacteriota bacterium]
MRRRRPAGAAVLLFVLICASVLTVIGLALKFATDAERIAASQEWSASRAFYAADAGIRWTIAQMTRSPGEFLSRPEFRDPPDPFGSVRFPFPAHRHGAGGPFTGDPGDDGIDVVVENPSPLGRRPYPSGGESGEPGAQFLYAFEVRVRASEAAPTPRFSFQVVADVEVGPLPEDFLDRGAIIADENAMTATGGAEPRPLRAVSRNWKVQ